MNQRTGLLVWSIALAIVLVVSAGCSSSSKSLGTSTLPTSVVPGGSAIGVTACSAATADQVKGLLGASPTGQEADYSGLYKTCTWTTGSGSSASTLSLKIIRIGGGQLGFGSSVLGLTAVGVSALGDKATYSSGRNSLGHNEVLLVANKGVISVSIDVRYGGTTTPPGSSQDVLESIARTLFTTLGA